MSHISELNPQQLEAVKHHCGPLVVFAGAGTGKTRVITHKIASLIHDKNVPPSRILAITFTNKAAQEMKTRVANITGALSAGVWISTFHSFCARILKIDSAAFGVAHNFVIYDENDQKWVIKEVLKELKLSDDKSFRPNALADKISRLKDDLVDAESYSINSIASNEPERRIFSEIYFLYQKKLNLACAVDFGDLILKVVEGMRAFPALLEKYQNKFDYILVDEYQDTNLAQYFLTKYLAGRHKNICVVGDDDQSIYSWRGADRKNITNIHKEYPNCKIVRLEQNYRSTPQILAAATAVIKKNLDRHPKVLWTELPQGDAPEYKAFSSDAQESQFIAAVIKGIEISFNKIAILYRMNAQSRVLEDALRMNYIPYRVVGTVKFYERAEVKNILAYLKLLVNTNDDIALKRIINTPSRGVGAMTVEKLQNYANAHSLSIFQAASIAHTLSGISKRTADRIMNFAELIRGWQNKNRTISASDAVKMVAEESGYLSELEQDDSLESKNRVANIKELVSAAVEFEEIAEDGSLEAYMREIALISDIDEINDSDDKVTISTVHLAKGLEFDTVFVAGLEEGIFPLASSFNRIDEIEEERRLFYVAVTRARKKIYFSYAASKVIYGQLTNLKPSRFIEESITSDAQEAAACADVSEAMHKEAAEQIAPEDLYWRLGVNVKHPSFGVGTITSASGNNEDFKVVVRFSDGKTRKLYVKYANLEIVK